MLMRRSPLFAALLLAPAVLPAQSAPVKTLAKAEAEFPEPFTQVSGVRELSDGQVVVADSRDKTLQLISFDGDAKKIGREGSGPGEYAMPLRLYPGPADTTFLFDPLNSRFLVIDPSGKAVSTFSLGDPESGMRGFMAPQAIDAKGRFYYRSSPIMGGGPGGGEAPRRADSLAIYRYDRATKRVDTLAFMKNDVNPTITGSRGNVNVRVMQQPFAPVDAWTVTPDGRLAIVRASDYHVEWIANGRKTSGAAIPFERVKVTDADKKAWREGRGGMTMVAFRTEDGRRAAAGAPQVSREVQQMSAANLPEPDWPEYKGPFSNVMAAPDGRVWVQRHVRANEPPTYDVIDASGRVVQKVVLPRKARVVGFGKGTVYVTRVDEDDLQYLQRYRM